MGKKNYSKHYDNPEVSNEAVDAVEETVTEQTNDTPTMYGTVVGCAKLNVRVKPSVQTDVVCKIEKGTKVLIDVDRSTDEFYKVCIENGAEGFCLRDYITINL